MFLRIRGISRLTARFLAAACLLASDEVSGAELQSLFYIADVKPVIAAGASTRWFDGEADEGRVSAFMTEAVGAGAARSLKGARPLVLEVRVHRFLPVRPEDSSAFGPNHEIRADYVLVDGATGTVQDVSPQILDLFTLWLQSTEAIRGADGQAPQRRLANHIALISEVWGRGLSCENVRCDLIANSPAFVPELTDKVETNGAIVLESASTETHQIVVEAGSTALSAPAASSASTISANPTAKPMQVVVSSPSAHELVPDGSELAPLPETPSTTAVQPTVGGLVRAVSVVDLSGAISSED